MFRRLLVAFDGSPPSRAALDAAVELAEANNGRLTVITVPARPLCLGSCSPYWASVDMGDVRGETERAYRVLLDDAVAAIPATIPVTKLLVPGTARRAILEEAGRNHDVIVIGSRGRHRLQALSFGCVSRHVARRCPIPVLFVQPPPTRKEQPCPTPDLARSSSPAAAAQRWRPRSSSSGRPASEWRPRSWLRTSTSRRRLSRS